jgi:nucleotide-binding universal stress UspA family protein
MVLFAAVFAALVLSAYHAPKPHGLPVGIVAPATVTRQVERALDQAAPGAFDPQVYVSEGAARTGLSRGTLDGALIDTGGRPRLLLALAQGTAPAQALTTAFDAFAAHSGRTLLVTDVVPPLPDDSLALSPFFVILSVLLPGMAAGSASALVFRRSGALWCVGAPFVAAVGIGVVAAAIVNAMTGFGHYPVIAGIVTLFTLAIALPTAALGRVRPPLIALAVLVLVVLSIPVSGGPSGLGAFTPAYLRVLRPALPLGVAAGAVRSVVYFGGHGTAGPLTVLAAWAVGGFAALTAVTLRRQAQARDVAPGPAGAAAAAAGEGNVSRPSGTASPTSGVVVGFDDSAPSRRALGAAARLAATRRQILHVVYADHVIIASDLAGFAHTEMEDARNDEASRVAEVAAEISAEAGVTHTFERSRSAPAEAILSAASALADGSEPGSGPLIVVGRSGHGAHRLLGSVPTDLLAHSSFPVLAIP